MTRAGATPAARLPGTPLAAVLLAVGLGLTACSDTPAPEVSGVSEQDLDEVRDEVSALQDRIDGLEEQLAEAGPDEPGGPDEEPGDEPAPEDEPDREEAEDTFFGDPATFLGEAITVQGQVAEVLASTDVASAFRLAGEGGDPVPVISATPLPDVARGVAVEVSGRAVEVDPATFEADFGIAADALFDDPAAWLADAEGTVAVAADAVQPDPAADRD